MSGALQVEEAPREHGRRGAGQRQRAPGTSAAQEEGGGTAAERAGESAGQRRDRGRHQPGVGRVRRHPGRAEGQERGVEEVQTKSNGKVTPASRTRPRFVGRLFSRSSKRFTRNATTRLFSIYIGIARVASSAKIQVFNHNYTS